MSSTRSFDFTSEELRLVHSFDEEGGMWIRCLPCYNYALTTKKGNNLAKDPSLVKLRSPFMGNSVIWELKRKKIKPMSQFTILMILKKFTKTKWT